MAKESRRLSKVNRRRRRIAKASTQDAPPPPSGIHSLPDDLLELIFLRVRTPVCLFRAAATCKPWRRVISGAGFLDRFHSLHGQRLLLLGHYCVTATEKTEHGGATRRRRLHAEFVPSPQRPAPHLRRRLALDFSADSDEEEEEHVLTDSRGGLLAFVSDNRRAAVFDPCTWQSWELDLPWAHVRHGRHLSYNSLGSFLLDSGGEDGGGGFRVLCPWLVMDDRYHTVTAQACVFSVSGRSYVRSPGVSMNAGVAHWACVDPQDTYKRFMGRAGGCIFWLGLEGHVLVLDETTLEFSAVRLPAAAPSIGVGSRVSPLYDSRELRVISGGGDGGVRVVRLLRHGEIEVFTRAAGHGAGEFTVERRLCLWKMANIEARAGRSWRFLDSAMAAAADLVLGVGGRSGGSATMKLFSFDARKMKLQRMNKGTAWRAERVLPCEVPWPQTINARLLFTPSVL